MDSTTVATWIQAIGSAGSLLAFAAWLGIAIINRRDEQEAPVYHCAVDFPGLLERKQPSRVLVQIVPIDSSGRRWERDGNGVLSEL